MILHTQWDTTLIADAATGVKDFYSLKQIQTVVRPRSYPLLCQFLMKIIAINLVCACVKTSAEDDDFQSLSKGGERERVCVCFITLIIKMLCRYNSIFGCALLWDRTTTLISRLDEYSICYVMLCYIHPIASNNNERIVNMNGPNQGQILASIKLTWDKTCD